MSKPTPTTHGAWRVINGQLVDENERPPVVVSVHLVGSTPLAKQPLMLSAPRSRRTTSKPPKE